MTKQDVGKLKPGDRIIACGKKGTVVDPNEYDWIDPKTKEFKKEFLGAEIQFDDDGRGTIYVHNLSIKIL